MADYSFIANTPKYEPINPLAVAGQFAQTAGALQGLQARQAIGQAFQGAADPQTGQIDYQKALGAITQDPRAAWMAPQITQQIQQQQLLNFKLNEAQLAQTQQRVGAIRSSMGAFLAKPDDQVNTGDVTSMLAGMKAAGYPVDEFVNMAATTMPTGGKPLKDWVLQQVGSMVPPAEQFAVFGPRPTLVDTRGGSHYENTNPYNNPSIIGKQFDYTLTPSERLDLRPAPPDLEGNVRTQTGEELARARGLQKLIPGDGRLPSSLLNPNRQASAAQMPGAYPDAGGSQADSGAAPSASSPGPMVTAYGPTKMAGLQAEGATSSELYKNLTTAATGIPDRQGALTAMLGDLTNMDTGKNSEVYRSLINRMVQMGISTEGMKEGQASYENFEKMSQQLLQRQAAMIGGGAVTNDRLASAGMATPNQAFSTLGNIGVIHVFQGNEDALAAKNAAWLDAQKRGYSIGKFDEWQGDFNKTFDPRAFWLARMSQQERQTLLKGMSPTDLKKFKNNVAGMVDQGVLDPNQIMGGGQ